MIIVILHYIILSIRSKVRRIFMKYTIIASMFVLLFLACNPDFNTNQKDVKYQFSKKRLKSNKKGFKPKTEVPQNQEVDPN